MRIVATTYICTKYHSSLLCFSSSCSSSIFPLLLFLNRLRFWKCVWYFCILMYTNNNKNQLMKNNNWLSHQKSFDQTQDFPSPNLILNARTHKTILLEMFYRVRPFLDKKFKNFSRTFKDTFPIFQGLHSVQKKSLDSMSFLALTQHE